MSDLPKVGTVVINSTGIWVLVQEVESGRTTLLDLCNAKVYAANKWNQVTFPEMYIDGYADKNSFLIQDVATKLRELMNET